MFLNWMIITSELFLFAVNVLETGHVSKYCFRKSFSEIRIRQFCTN